LFHPDWPHRQFSLSVLYAFHTFGTLLTLKTKAYEGCHKHPVRTHSGGFMEKELGTTGLEDPSETLVQMV